jgi:hypothetical protein
VRSSTANSAHAEPGAVPGAATWFADPGAVPGAAASFADPGAVPGAAASFADPGAVPGGAAWSARTVAGGTDPDLAHHLRSLPADVRRERLYAFVDEAVGDCRP